MGQAPERDVGMCRVVGENGRKTCEGFWGPFVPSPLILTVAT